MYAYFKFIHWTFQDKMASFYSVQDTSLTLQLDIFLEFEFERNTCNPKEYSTVEEGDIYSARN